MCKGNAVGNLWPQGKVNCLHWIWNLLTQFYTDKHVYRRDQRLVFLLRQKSCQMTHSCRWLHFEKSMTKLVSIYVMILCVNNTLSAEKRQYQRNLFIHLSVSVFTNDGPAQKLRLFKLINQRSADDAVTRERGSRRLLTITLSLWNFNSVHTTMENWQEEVKDDFLVTRTAVVSKSKVTLFLNRVNNRS